MQRYHFSSIPSTNDWAKENLALFKELTLVTADTQTAGRGRHGRKWHSPEYQNIYATFIFFSKEETLDQAYLVQMLATLTQELLNNQGVVATIKWPNDLLIKGKKVAGILVETVPMGKKTAIIMGIGLNVNMPQVELDKIDQPTTSLMLETNTFWDKDLLINALARAFAHHLTC